MTAEVTVAPVRLSIEERSHFVVAAQSFLAEMRHAVAAAADRALDLAIPPACPGCDRERTVLCRECRPSLDARLGAAPGVPADLPGPLAQLEWCAPFAGVARRAINQLKSTDERRLATPLGDAIAARWRIAGAGGDVLVPVPASPSRIQERGYDQAALLAQAAGRRLRMPVVDGVRRTRDTTAHVDLDRASRSANVADAFEVVAPGRIRGRWVVLVDDVVTTGATLAACAAAVLDAGALAVSAVTVAREL